VEGNGVPPHYKYQVGNYNFYLIIKMDSFIVKILTGRKLAPHLDVRVGPTIQNTVLNDKLFKIGLGIYEPFSEEGN